jgi:hypothetical protein
MKPEIVFKALESMPQRNDVVGDFLNVPTL